MHADSACLSVCRLLPEQRLLLLRAKLEGLVVQVQVDVAPHPESKS
jgi:hypothetical protein